MRLAHELTNEEKQEIIDAVNEMKDLSKEEKEEMISTLTFYAARDKYYNPAYGEDEE